MTSTHAQSDSSRRPFVGGNWKMNTTADSAAALAGDVASGLSNENDVEVAVYPPFVYLPATMGRLKDSSVRIGAQNVYHEPSGAFTGEISVSMLRDCQASSVLIGHSERRHVLGENDDLVNQKVHAAFAGDLQVVLCVGETEQQRESGETEQVVLDQINLGLANVAAEHMPLIVVAYEPVWAIGTGRTATADDAQSVHAVIRQRMAEMYNPKTASTLRIIYGGSVKPANAAELFAETDIDGFLVGGASLKADDFLEIIRSTCVGVG